MGLAVYPWQEELAHELVSFKDNLPNGLLVYGPRGIGTIDLVIAYAKSLFCEHPHKDGTPCGLQNGQRLYASGLALRCERSRIDPSRYPF